MLLLFGVLATASQAAPPDYPPVLPGRVLSFPRDHGAHPDYRTEWWYVTGWLRGAAGQPVGFQLTFFRSRPPLDQSNPSRFAAKQLLFAHAAVSDPAHGRLGHDQRSARAGFGLAEASSTDTDVRIDAWRFRREADDTYTAKLPGREFTLELRLRPTQPILLQGGDGFSRKGPLPEQASYYYSRPHLQVVGTLERAGQREAVRGDAWLDHEWSTAYLAPEASGWDWTGIHLDDGGALMLFQIRARSGGGFWASGTLRTKGGEVQTYGPNDVSFVPLRRWRSPRTGTDYPVGMRVRAGELELDLEPLLEDQELDSRASTGAVYWEGAVTALRKGVPVGRGYLELTGYFQPLRM
jgi:predicted secreted hydrolase